MKIFIIGLGLIGASYAKKLNQDHTVYGYDINEQTNAYALKNHIVASTDLNKISEADVLILALYQHENIQFIKNHKNALKTLKLITDVSGLKETMVHEIEALLKDTNVPYLSHHPMAGKETSGIEASDASMFTGKKAIIIETKQTTETSKALLTHLLRTLGFAQITSTTPKVHDIMIAKTSQLPHILALALIDSTEENTVHQAAANSFEDLTRIANINIPLWHDLFLSNAGALKTSIDELTIILTTISAILDSEDAQALKAFMARAKMKKK